MRTRQTYALKLVIVASNDLSAFIVMALELSSFWAMFVLPQGCAFEGLWTSFRAGLPLTPSTGAIAACALTSMEMERRMATEAIVDLEKNMMARVYLERKEKEV